VPDVDRQKYRLTNRLKTTRGQGAPIPVLATKYEPDRPVNNQDISISPIIAQKHLWHAVWDLKVGSPFYALNQSQNFAQTHRSQDIGENEGYDALS